MKKTLLNMLPLLIMIPLLLSSCGGPKTTCSYCGDNFSGKGYTVVGSRTVKVKTGQGYLCSTTCALKQSGRYQFGKKDGLYNSWYSDGQKKSESTYKDGEKVGTWTYWYENGQKKSEEVTLTPEQKSEILREEIEELLKQDKYTPVHEIDIDQSKCNLKLAKQFAYNRLSKASYGSGTNLYGQFVKYKDSPFFCRYKFTGTMFDRYNNPSFFSISVKYNGYSWNVENFDIQPW